MCSYFELDSSMWAITFMQSFPWYRPLHPPLYSARHVETKEGRYRFIPRSRSCYRWTLPRPPPCLKDESVTIRNSGGLLSALSFGTNVNFCGLEHRCNSYCFEWPLVGGCIDTVTYIIEANWIIWSLVP